MDRSLCSIIENNNSKELYQLHSNGLDPNYGLNNGTNLLTHAAVNYSYNIMDTLLRCGANINGLDNNGETIFTHLCTRDGNYAQVIQYLIDEGGDINKENTTGLKPAVLCAKYGHYWNLKQILESEHDIDSTDDCGVTLLMIASCYNNVRCVKLLLQRNADVNRQCHGMGQTALMKILICKNPDQKLDIIHLLLLKKADVNITDIFEENAFFLAVQRNNHTLISLFMNYNANINMKNSRNVTPFLLALSNGNFDLCKVFIKMKCNRSMITNYLPWHSNLQMLFKIAQLLGNDRNTQEWVLANKLFFGSGEKWPDPSLLNKQHAIATAAMNKQYNTLLECARYSIRKHLMKTSSQNLIWQIKTLPLPKILKRYLYFM